jgi:hypothetical protein
MSRWWINGQTKSFEMIKTVTITVNSLIEGLLAELFPVDIVVRPVIYFADERKNDCTAAGRRGRAGD